MGAEEQGIEARLTELGLRLPPVAAPAGSYVPAVFSKGVVYTSGQLPFVDGALPATGKVGDGPGLVSPAEAQTYAGYSVLNALAAAKSVIGSLDRITRILKVTGFVSSDPGFFGQPSVINGASDLLAQIFGDRGHHARSAVGVAVLPLNSPVEVELVLEVEEHH
ncbi:RidA family protein [Frondihabitans cladoniiphilus]|uniref:RidA family protein n=1 Tax=Frondihabitans cladoniiphilus TaxID=715785 RepID=A0ABP8W0K6_9MICO